MFKFKLIGIVMLLFSLNGYAQSTWFETPKSNAQNPKSTTLSPQEFKSRVQSLGQKSQDAVQKQIDQTMSKIKPVEQPKTESAQPSIDMQPAQPRENTDATTTDAEPQNPPPAKIPQAATPVAPEPAPTPAPAQTQTYSGFQGNSSSGTKNSGSQQQSGGWNVKY
jgi:hypothetical protein